MRFALTLALTLLATPAVAAPIVAGIPATPNGPPTGAPVQIESCVVRNRAAAARVVGSGILALLATRASTPAAAIGAAVGSTALVAATKPQLVITLTNESDQAADLIRVQIDGLGAPFYIRAEQLFASGVPTTVTVKDAPVDQGFFETGDHPLGCSISFIHFRDTNGVWSAPGH